MLYPLCTDLMTVNWHRFRWFLKEHGILRIQICCSQDVPSHDLTTLILLPCPKMSIITNNLPRHTKFLAQTERHLSCILAIDKNVQCFICWVLDQFRFASVASLVWNQWRLARWWVFWTTADVFRCATLGVRERCVHFACIYFGRSLDDFFFRQPF